MRCEQCREAVSARLDGEDPGIDERLVDGHLARCPACREFASAADRTRRTHRVTLAGEMPDMSRRIRKLAALADRAGRWSIARMLLAVVAIEIIVFSLPPLVLGDERLTSTHSARHLGAFSAAYGVGLLVVAVRPARARTMLPVAAVLAGALAITAIVDLANRQIPLVGEARHLPEMLSVLLVWMLAVPAPRRSRRAAVPRRSPPLHVVDEHRDAV